MLKLNRMASVVEYNSARVLLASMCEYALHRKSDSYLVAVPDPELKHWREDYDDKEIIASFYVDQGSYSSVLDLYTGELRFSHVAEELIDFEALLATIAKWLDPDYVPEPSPYMGRGKSTSWYINQHWKMLENHEDELKEHYVELVKTDA